MSTQIEDLAARAQEQYRTFTGPESPVKSHIVTPSIPVLYFGNLGAYRESSPKVLTVGHNPSNKEFECAEERFSGLEEKEVYDTSGYLRALNEYFEGGSDYSWFSSYEKVLRGLGASYQTGGDQGTPALNTALHTDLHSPLATHQQWSNLSNEVQEALAEDGENLWHDLIKLLQPDVIVASLPFGDVERTCKRLSTNGSGSDEAVELHRITEKKDGEDRSSDYVVKGWWREVGENLALIVYGKKAQVPFGAISDDQKREVGRAIRDEIFSG